MPLQVQTLFASADTVTVLAQKAYSMMPAVPLLCLALAGQTRSVGHYLQCLALAGQTRSPFKLFAQQQQPPAAETLVLHANAKSLAVHNYILVRNPRLV
jgi:hypothetical protein